MPQLSKPLCNYAEGEYSITPLTGVTFDNSSNKGLLNDWLTKQSMGTTRHGASAFFLNGKGYVCGGGNVGYLSSVECYDPLTDTWSTKASMNTPRFRSGGFVLEDKGYVCGGLNGSTVLNTLEEYDDILNTWTFKAPFTQTPRQDFSTFVVGGKGYVCGGLILTATTNLVECYDKATDTWSPKASMPQARLAAPSFSINDIGYVCFGGSESAIYSTAISYNHLTDTWSSIAGSTEVWTYGTGFELCGYGYIVNANNTGGIGTEGANRVVRYEPLLNSWVAMSSSPKAKIKSCSFVIDDKAYICGGVDGSYLNTVESIQAVISDIYYTTDGTVVSVNEVPNPTAIKYTEPFDLPIPAVLRFTAIPRA